MQCNALAKKAGCDLPFDISLTTVTVPTDNAADRFGLDLRCSEDIETADHSRHSVEKDIDNDDLDRCCQQSRR